MTFTYEDFSPEPTSRAADKDSPGRWGAIVRGARSVLSNLRGPSPGRELPDFTRQLATLLQAGTNPPEALQSLRADVQSRELRAAVEALEVATKRGLPLYAAMRQHPRIFDRVYTEIVAAGEISGTLERMLDPLAAGLIMAAKIRSKVSRAMIQPMFSLAATFLGGWYMVQKVVPTFADIYQREGVELPVVTRCLIGVAHVAAAAGDSGLIVLGIVFLLLPKVVGLPAVRGFSHRIVLRLPIAGPLARNASVASFMRFFAMLLSTEAIQEAEAIELAAQTAPNHVIADRLALAARDVAAGTRNVSGALERTRVVSPTYIQILRTGERTGQVPRLATYAADRLEDTVLNQVERAQDAVVPLATIVVIAVVAVMLIGLYGPMTGLYKVLLR